MSLSLDQIKEFHTNGVLVVENAFTEDDLAPVIADIEAEVDRRARELFAEGKITGLYENESYLRRFILLHDQYPDIDKQFDIPYIRSRGFFEFLRNDHLLDIAECLLGTEIECNPVQHVRAKRPYKDNGRSTDYFQNTPWHQDAGVIREEADFSDIITFWVPLQDTTEEMGCLEAIPEAFKGGLLEHRRSDTSGTTILSSMMPNMESRKLPCPKGGLILLNKLTPHQGKANLSNKMRWSMDLRYHKTGQPSGRSHQPSFVARSRKNPGSELTDIEIWRESWIEALKIKGMQKNRAGFN